MGSLRICRLNAATTAAVSLLRTFTRAVKREWRSTDEPLDLTVRKMNRVMDEIEKLLPPTKDARSAH
jgi:hypothetical protein